MSDITLSNGSDIVKELNQLMKEYGEFRYKYTMWYMDKKKCITIFLMSLDDDMIKKGFIDQNHHKIGSYHFIVNSFDRYIINPGCDFKVWWDDKAEYIIHGVEKYGLLKKNKYDIYEITNKCKTLYKEFRHSKSSVDITKLTDGIG